MQTKPETIAIRTEPEREPMRPRKRRRAGGKGLILSRRIGQSIVVDGPARIMIVGLSGSYARIATDAPDGTTILREELIEGNRDTAA